LVKVELVEEEMVEALLALIQTQELLIVVAVAVAVDVVTHNNLQVQQAVQV
jgi:hypothetical protein